MAKRTKGKPGKSDSILQEALLREHAYVLRGLSRADQRSSGMTDHSKHKLVPIDRDLTAEDLIGAKVVSVEFGPYGQLLLYFDNDRAISAISTDGESSFFYSIEPLP